MTMTTANRYFYGLLLLAAAPFLALGLLGCSVLVETAARLISDGPHSLDGGLPGAVATVFVVATALGVARALHRLAVQVRATITLIDDHTERRLVPPDRLVAAARRAGLGHIELVADPAAFSYTYGLFSPRVVISSALLDDLGDNELDAVLTHEAFHVANRDPLKIAVARAVTAGLWFVPATHHLLDGYRASRELDADRRAADQAGRDALAAAILRASTFTAPQASSAVAAFGGPDLLEARVTQLETGNPPALAPIGARGRAITVGWLGLLAIGAATTSVALGVPSVLQAGGRMELTGATACAAMWLVAAHALMGQRDRPTAARHHRPAA